MDIDLKAVIYFAHVARTRSFSRSATELGVSQPWLSARIRRLELRLGCELLERTTRRVNLTAEGERLLGAAELLTLSAASIETIGRDLRESAVGRLRVGSPPIASRITRRIELVELFADRTGAAVEIDIGWTKRLLDRLRRGELDAAFAIDPFDDQALDVIAFCDMSLALLIRPSDPLAGRSNVAAPELAGRRIGGFVRALNPDAFDRLYSPLQAAGATVIELPEIRRSLLTSLEGQSLDMLGVIEPLPLLARADGQGPVKLSVADLPHIELKLVRRAGANTRTCDRFWEMARAYVQSPSG